MLLSLSKNQFIFTPTEKCSSDETMVTKSFSGGRSSLVTPVGWRLATISSRKSGHVAFFRDKERIATYLITLVLKPAAKGTRLIYNLSIDSSGGAATARMIGSVAIRVNLLVL
jgi:hypothetical protein